MSVPTKTVCEIFSAYILTRVLVADLDETDRDTVGLLEEGGVLSCLGEDSGSTSRLLRGKVPYLSAATRVADASAAVDSRWPFVGHFFSSTGEFGVLHLAADVFVGLARRAGLSRTRFGRSVVGLIRGLGVRGRGFSGGVGFSLLLARSRVARLGPRGAVTGLGPEDPTGELLFGSATVTFTRRRGRGGAPASEELSEPHPEPQETTLDAQERDPPPLLSARPHPSTPLSLPAAPSANSSPAGKLSRSPIERASSIASHDPFSTNDSLKSTLSLLQSSKTSPAVSLSSLIVAIKLSLLWVFLHWGFCCSSLLASSLEAGGASQTWTVLLALSSSMAGF